MPNTIVYHSMHSVHALGCSLWLCIGQFLPISFRVISLKLRQSRASKATMKDMGKVNHTNQKNCYVRGLVMYMCTSEMNIPAKFQKDFKNTSRVIVWTSLVIQRNTRTAAGNDNTPAPMGWGIKWQSCCCSLNVLTGKIHRYQVELCGWCMWYMIKRCCFRHVIT